MSTATEEKLKDEVVEGGRGFIQLLNYAQILSLFSPTSTFKTTTRHQESQALQKF